MENNKKKKFIFIILLLFIIFFILWFFMFKNTKGIFYENLYTHLTNNEYGELSVDEEFLVNADLFDENYVCDKITFDGEILKLYDCIIEEDNKEKTEEYCTYDGEELNCVFSDNNSDNELEDEIVEEEANDNNLDDQMDDDIVVEQTTNNNSANSSVNTGGTTNNPNGNINNNTNNENNDVPDEELNTQGDIVFNLSNNGYSKDDVTVKVTSTDNLKYCVTSGDTCNPNTDLIDDVILSTEGSNRVCVTEVGAVNAKVVCSDKVIIDKTNPIIGEPIITGTMGNDGWYTSDVVISDNNTTDNLGLASVVISDELINYDTASKEITITATDKAGNVSTKQVTVKVDKTAPIIADYNIVGTEGENGWYRSGLIITGLTGTDNLSGINSVVANETVFATETAGTNLIITATDNAGNITEEVVEIKIDNTAPLAADFVISGTEGNNGWYKSNVSISTTGGTDSLSGISNTILSKSIIDYEVSEEVVTLTTKDNAGNTSTKNVTIKVDKTAPIINDYTFNGTMGENGWYTSLVELGSLSGTDNLSGVSSVTANKTRFPDETAGTDVVVTAIDNAGNISTSTTTIKIDKTAPVITDYDLVGTLGESDWYISDVTIDNITATDNLAGVNNSTLNDVVIDYETVGENVIIEVKDNAGHITRETAFVKIDKTAPIVGEIILEGTLGLNGWYTSDVNVETTDGSDLISGVKEAIVDVEIITGVDLETTVNLRTIDNAGHVSSTSKTVKIDKVIPEVGDIIVEGTLGENGWYTSNVTIGKTDGTDDGSGHELTVVDILSINTNTVGTRVNITTIDQAGNRVTETEVIKIDKELPSITQEQDIKIGLTESVDLTTYFSADYGVSEGVITCNVSNTAIYAVGVHNLTCTATSNAGLTATINTTFEVDSYIRLDYLESNGKQYFDSGLMNSGNYIIEDTVYLISNTTTYGSWLFGARRDINDTFGVHVQMQSTSKQLFSSYGGITSPIGITYSPFNKWVDVYYDLNTFIFDDHVHIQSGQTLIDETEEVEIRIGGLNQTSAVDSRNFVGRRSEMIITDADTSEVLRHFIPIKKLGTTSEVGYLDLINDVFYKSEGTEEFITP